VFAASRDNRLTKITKRGQELQGRYPTALTAPLVETLFQASARLSIWMHQSRGKLLFIQKPTAAAISNNSGADSLMLNNSTALWQNGCQV